MQVTRIARIPQSGSSLELLRDLQQRSRLTVLRNTNLPRSTLRCASHSLKTCRRTRINHSLMNKKASASLYALSNPLPDLIHGLAGIC